MLACKFADNPWMTPSLSTGPHGCVSADSRGRSAAFSRDPHGSRDPLAVGTSWQQGPPGSRGPPGSGDPHGSRDTHGSRDPHDSRDPPGSGDLMAARRRRRACWGTGPSLIPSQGCRKSLLLHEAWLQELCRAAVYVCCVELKRLEINHVASFWFSTDNTVFY